MDNSRRFRTTALIAASALASLLTATPAQAGAPFVVTRYGDFNLDFTDLHEQGGLNMEITRVYNSFGNASTGIFGTGWGSRAEDSLQVEDDGSIVIHEYGGGASNKFEPTTSTVRPQAEIIDAIEQAAEQTGQFGSEADRQAYRASLESSSDNEEVEWEKFVKLGLLKSQAPAIGETFFSGRFATEFITREPEGYQRSTTYAGQTIFEAFDLSGRLTRFWDANRDYIALMYGSDGHLRESLDNEGNRFTFSFTADGLVRVISDSQGHVVRYNYVTSNPNNSDLLADLKSVTVNGSTTRFDYDADHRLTAIHYPDRTSLQIWYDESGLAHRVKDTDGTVNTYSYSTKKSQTSTVDTFESDSRKPSGETHRKTYQYFYEAPDYYENGEIETDDGVVATDTTYDRNFDPLSVTTAKGVTTYGYDSLSRTIRKQMPTGTVFSWEYDPATGRVSTAMTTTKTSVLTEHFQYDPKGNLARAYDSDGHDFTVGYDSYKRIEAVTGSTMQLHFGYADNRISHPATVALDGVGTVLVSYLADGTVSNAQSSGGASVVDKVRTSLATVDDLIRAAGVDVIRLPAPSP
jgi:YD repeat-containing protein